MKVVGLSLSRLHDKPQGQNGDDFLVSNSTRSRRPCRLLSGPFTHRGAHVTKRADENEIRADSVAAYGERTTQILWKSTTELGCAVATCNKVCVGLRLPRVPVQFRVRIMQTCAFGHHDDRHTRC